MRALLNAVGPVLGAQRLRFGPDLMLCNATIGGPVRVDLYAERASSCGRRSLLGPPLVLFDRAALTDAMGVDPDRAVQPPAAQLAGLVNRYAYGFMWPVRLLGRGNHTTALMNATIIAHEFLVPALLAQELPAEMHRELLSAERFLSQGSRTKVAELLDGIAEGYLARSTDGGVALAGAHKALVASILGELDAACAQHGVDWPDSTESATDRYLLTRLGRGLPPSR